MKDLKQQMLQDLYNYYIASDFGIDLYENYNIDTFEKFATYYENNKDIIVYDLIECIKELESEI